MSGHVTHFAMHALVKPGLQVGFAGLQIGVANAHAVQALCFGYTLQQCPVFFFLIGLHENL